LVAIVIAAVVAAAIFALFSVSTREPAAETVSRENMEEARIDVLERNLHDLQQRLDHLNAAIEAVEGRTVALGSAAENTGKEPTSAPGGDTAAKPEREDGQPTGEREDAPAIANTGDIEHLRQVVRSELRRVDEERRDNRPRGYQQDNLEEWEKKEFGDLARWVHNRGKQLGLTDQQKRQYHSVVEEYQENTGNLWEQVRKEYPDTEREKLGGIYRERYGELTRDTRELVLDVLNREQQKKYRKLFNDDNWYR
jgi:vacuolar-type H+-ATPase subunit I/STV1